MEKKRYFYEVGLGFAGCNKNGVIETNLDEDSIYEWLRQEAIDNASSYGYEQDIDYFYDLDQVGCEWDEEEECYLNEGCLEYWFEDYDPEEHEGYVTYGNNDKPEFEQI